jgi:hypothetical protein
MSELRHQPLDVFTACHHKDLPVLCVVARQLPKCVPFKKLHVATARRNFPRFAEALGSGVGLIDEDEFIPGLTLARLRELPEPGFPAGAGWYFQQLLKYQFAFQEAGDDHYLIWDADTVPLRPMEFFDERGRMLFTKAAEHHRPYFATYQNLLGQDPGFAFSLIAQHMIVRKSWLREMLQVIEGNIPGPENWAWKIMRGLGGDSTNRFSEFETYGYYVKNQHPEWAVFLERPWFRDGSRRVLTAPAEGELKRFGEKYDFVAYETKNGLARRGLKVLRSWFK